MNDPFAMLDPIGKPKAPSVPAYTAAPPAPTMPTMQHMGSAGGGLGMGMGMGMPSNGMSMGGMGMPGAMGGAPPMGLGGMGAQGMGGMGGMGAPPMGMGAPGMGMNMGMGMPGMGMGMGQPPQAAQAPVLYDNIKNLLQQKPKPPVVDDSSLNFLDSMGTAKANSISLSSPTSAATPAMDPFGGPVASTPSPVAAPTVSIGDFTFPGETPAAGSTGVSPVVSPSGGGARSSALADRLANNRRKTQEAQREQLGFNAGAFSQSTSAPRISLKEMAGQKSPSSARDSRTPSLEDFASGKTTLPSADNDFFGGGAAMVAPIAVKQASFGATAPKQASFGSTTTRSNGGSRTNSNSTFPSGDAVLADSDADFDKKLNGSSSSTGSFGSLGVNGRTSSGSSAQNTFW
ncbi:hypothetical protein ATCC90586_004107 [Pythium insidiosum]|nr:hypothetical protein ATCC90586_004107 [Pythium insidiosum]